MAADRRADNCALLIEHLTRTYLSPLLLHEGAAEAGKKRRTSESQLTSEAELFKGDDSLMRRVPTICKLLKDERALGSLNCETSPTHAKVRKRLLATLNQLLQSKSLANRWAALSVVVATLPQMDYETYRAHHRVWIDAVVSALRSLSAGGRQQNDDAFDERIWAQWCEAAVAAAAALLTCGFRWPDTRRDLTVARSAAAPGRSKQAGSGRQIDLTALVGQLVKCVRRARHNGGQERFAAPCLAALLRCLEAEPGLLRPQSVKIHFACLAYLDHDCRELRAMAASCLAALPMSKKPGAEQLKDDDWYTMLGAAASSLRLLLDVAFPAGAAAAARLIAAAKDLTGLAAAATADNDSIALPPPLSFPSDVLLIRNTTNSDTNNDTNNEDDDDDGNTNAVRLHWARVADNRVKGVTELIVQLLTRPYGFVASVPVAALLGVVAHMLSHVAPADGFAMTDPSTLHVLATTVRCCGHAIFDALLQRCQRPLLLPFHRVCAELLLRELHDHDSTAHSPAALALRLACYRSLTVMLGAFGACVWDSLAAETLTYLVKQLHALHSNQFADRLGGTAQLVTSFALLDAEPAVDSDRSLLLAVLACLQALAASCAAMCPAHQWSSVEKVVVLHCVAAQKSTFSSCRLSNVYECPRVRLALLQTLSALVAAPLAVQPPCLPFALHVFRTALTDPDHDVRLFAQQAQAVCLCLLRPRSLPFAVVNEPVVVQMSSHDVHTLELASQQQQTRPAKKVKKTRHATPTKGAKRTPSRRRTARSAAVDDQSAVTTTKKKKKKQQRAPSSSDDDDDDVPAVDRTEDVAEFDDDNHTINSIDDDDNHDTVNSIDDDDDKHDIADSHDDDKHDIANSHDEDTHVSSFSSFDSRPSPAAAEVPPIWLPNERFDDDESGSDGDMPDIQDVSASSSDPDF